jgi:hypothetical protein
MPLAACPLTAEHSHCSNLNLKLAPAALPLPLPCLNLPPTPPSSLPCQVGRIYQRFTSLAEGRVQNLMEARLPAGLPLGLGEGSSLTLVVEAGYEVRTARSIALTFRWAGGCNGGGAGWLAGWQGRKGML